MEKKINVTSANNALAKRQGHLISGYKIKLAIIGAGAMGSAVANGTISAGLIRPRDITVSDIDNSKLSSLAQSTGVNITTTNKDAVNNANVIVLAIKPALLTNVLSDLKEDIPQNALIISIAAGIDLETIEKALNRDIPVIRAMPNTPCQIGAGATAFCRSEQVSDKHVEIAQALFAALGISVEVTEDLMDAVTGLSGSGPAYVFVMIDAMTDAGVRVGLPRNIALKLAAQTVFGSAKMLIETDGHPGYLKDAVTSPGGTTIAGVDELEKNGFRSAIFEAVKAATNRSKELSEK